MADNNNKSLFTTIIHSICVLLILTAPIHATAQDENSELSATNQTTDTSSPNFDEDNKASYGPILKSDTLWKIAVANRPNSTVSNYQVMMALFNTNPNAFLRNDINTLVEGQFLRIPTLEEIRQVAPYPYGNTKTVTTEMETTDLTEKVEIVTVASIEDTSAVELTVKEEVEVNTSNEETTETVDVESSTPNTIAHVFNVEQEADLGTVETLKAENSELKESLSSVDDQLSYLQYEVAKATEMQAQMDDKLAQQNALLKEVKTREQKLLAQQRKLSEHQQGLFNNPITYWSINGLLAILVVILFVLVSRRKKIEQTVNNVNATDNVSVKTEQLEKSELTIKESVKEAIDENAEVTTVAIEKYEQIDVVEQSAEINTIEPIPTPSENEHVVTAFTAMELTPEKPDAEILDDEDLLAKLVPGGVQDNRNEDNVTIQATEDDLDIEQIIDDMLDEESKPAKLRSAREPLEELVTPDETNEQVSKESSSEVHEINDYDDVEFDKLLAEISAESEHIKPPNNVTQLRRTTEVKEHAIQDVVEQIKPNQEEKEFIAVEALLEESALAEELDESVFDHHKIDVGLDEFPEFTSQVNHVNVDDDKHGVNAKLDLAQVYIEIGDLDNAAVILKSVMKLGNSGQQQQAQDLLYSIK
ncbi:FimV/HubP family polar landmark protein [Thalassotalea fonticola]|uniref:FimV/HubP family polar landmark protein n=1 Tax=Thalassotalea fonticola TaxID=3065649 RepID=A0ABZ0GPC3_9GAMM|nr:FimV/HubP family polar landmark protein [Colwelliaceae bacterium S1-1]